MSGRMEMVATKSWKVAIERLEINHVCGLVLGAGTHAVTSIESIVSDVRLNPSSDRLVARQNLFLAIAHSLQLSNVDNYTPFVCSRAIVRKKSWDTSLFRALKLSLSLSSIL